MLKQIMNSCLLLLPAVILFTSCEGGGVRGSGDLVTETRSVENFDRLEISVPGTVRIHVGPTFQVKVQIEENILPFFESEVHNGRLELGFSRSVYDVDDLVLDVTVPSLEAISVSGSAQVNCTDLLQGHDLALDVSGSGLLRLAEVDLAELVIKLSGSGTIHIDGEATEMDISVSGSGHCDVLDCPAEDAEVSVSGSGSVRCHVTGHLEVSISGSGEVEYEGNPVLETHISGSGHVSRI
jgi:hypothetical protein